MPAGEQHAEARDTEGIGEKFRLAGEAKSYGLELVLADWCGDHGGDLAIFEFDCGLFKGLEGGGGGPLIGLARCAGTAISDDFKLVALRNLCGCESKFDNFRADAGGVTECDEDAGHKERFLCSYVLPSGNRQKIQISRLVGPMSW